MTPGSVCSYFIRLSPILPIHDVIKWKHFPRYWPFVRRIHRSTVNSPHEGQWRGALMFSLICARINGWVNNYEAGDLRRHCTHYDVIIMLHVSFSVHLAFLSLSVFSYPCICLPVLCFSVRIINLCMWIFLSEDFCLSVCVCHCLDPLETVTVTAPAGPEMTRWPMYRHFALTHWGQDKITAISQTIFSNAFYSTNFT